MHGDEKIISTHASIAWIGSIGMGPPKAASGVAGGHGEQQGRTPQKRRGPAARREAHAQVAAVRGRIWLLLSLFITVHHWLIFFAWSG